MDKFKILSKLELPSKEQLRERSKRWEDQCAFTFIDQWPSEIMELSYRTILVPFNIDLLDEWHGDNPRIGEESHFLAKEIDDITGFKSYFFRLNSRSPKDASWPFELPLSCSGKEMVKVLQNSERVLDDLCRFRHSIYKPYLCLREFDPTLTPDREYRVFVKNNKIKAVAEYKDPSSYERYGESLPSEKEYDERNNHIRAFCIEKVIPFMKKDTFVVDVFYKYENIKLIEINPYGLSDPCGAITYSAIEEGIYGIAKNWRV